MSSFGIILTFAAVVMLVGCLLDIVWWDAVITCIMFTVGVCCVVAVIQAKNPPDKSVAEKYDELTSETASPVAEHECQAIDSTKYDNKHDMLANLGFADNDIAKIFMCQQDVDSKNLPVDVIQTMSTMSPNQMKKCKSCSKDDQHYKLDISIHNHYAEYLVKTSCGHSVYTIKKNINF